MNKHSIWLKALLYGLLLTGIYFTALTYMLAEWKQPRFNYCYFIPFIVLYLIWEKRGRLAAMPSEPSWKGLIPFGFGISFFWLGELGGEFFTLFLSIWLVVVGLCWMHLGWEKVKTIGFALIFILTMFPLPDFFINKLMLQLQLISSKLGVFLIQLYGMPVARQGNVIDIGFAKLQVVEACSGLNSLISLTVLCLLLVYFFKDHIWKRAVLLISAVPLAILTNSGRIALTAILHKHFGSDVAQGFFHGFSGMVIFLISIPALLLEMKVLKKLPPVARKTSRKSSASDMHPSRIKPDRKGQKTQPGAALSQPIFVVAIVFLAATYALSRGVDFREKIPPSKSLDKFPLKLANWSAQSRQALARDFLKKLDLSEYVIADYQNAKGRQINTYVAYYERQSKGKSIHSPATCLPGSGWSFDESGTVLISGLRGNPETMKVSRAVTQYGQSTQITYYWFAQRGRILNNAYQLKLYNFWDALTMQRTDGALIRLITPVYKNEKIADADARLQNFMKAFVPVLEEYIPGRELHSVS
jgi:exosortase D (VPLPA-CTERM-specific)